MPRRFVRALGDCEPCLRDTDLVYGLLWLMFAASALWLGWRWFCESSWGARWYLWRLHRRKARRRRRQW